MIQLLPPAELLKRAKALAVLDLILSPEWECRYYSFNCQWSEGEMMASMRNGCGDEWWIVFNDAGRAAMKGLLLDSPAWREGGEALSEALQSACPEGLGEFATEPAFRWDSTGFCYFWTPERATWSRANDLTPFAHLDAGEAELCQHLTGTAEDYQVFAREYFEVEVPIEIIRDIFNGKPIDTAIVTKLNPEIDLDDIEEELLHEIGHPD